MARYIKFKNMLLCHNVEIKDFSSTQILCEISHFKVTKTSNLSNYSGKVVHMYVDIYIRQIYTITIKIPLFNRSARIDFTWGNLIEVGFISERILEFRQIVCHSFVICVFSTCNHNLQLLIMFFRKLVLMGFFTK